ncbi:MAG: LLM class flavin-dependent oxidoreductase [Thermoprotei archaeon]
MGSRNNSQSIGIALRSENFAPHLLGPASEALDRSVIDTVWFPDVGSYDALELCAYTLGRTSHVKVATGVIRFYEHTLEGLARRIRTLTEAGGKRLILGIGAGRKSGQSAVEEIGAFARTLKEMIDDTGTKLVVSALRKRMTESALQHSDGVLFNFCYPPYIRNLLDKVQPSKEKIVAGYVKLYYSRTKEHAQEMMLQEFQKYSSIPNYRSAFEQMGLLDQILAKEVNSPKLNSISLPNPSGTALANLLAEMRHAGLNHVVIYPYIDGDDEFKLEVLRRIVSECS